MMVGAVLMWQPKQGHVDSNRLVCDMAHHGAVSR